jgi:hypothetical protein
MTEDELLSGIADALTITGTTWVHHRNSRAAITQGSPGLPDVLALVTCQLTHTPRTILLAWELKTRTGELSADQWRWYMGLARVDGVDARIIRPGDYDAALAVILHRVHPSIAFAGTAPDGRTWGEHYGDRPLRADDL